MAKKGFYVSHQGKTLGPWELSDLEAELHQGGISYVDYVWAPEVPTWQMLAVYFQDRYPAPTTPPPGVKISTETQTTISVAAPAAAEKKGKMPPAISPDLKRYQQNAFDQQFGISNESIWFLYRDKEKYGPYRFLEIVQLLQERKCEQTDFIWKPGMNDWERLRNVAEFSADILARLSNVKSFNGINLDTVFIKRQFPRVPYDSEVILHDDRQVVVGSATTISEGGAFVRVARPTHQRGDRLKLHFSAAGVALPFNCIAEVTQVCKTEPAGYCLKFIYLEQEDQERIAKYASKEVRAKQV